MSSSVVPPAQWSGPSPAGSTTETTTANRPLTAVPSKLANGNGKTDQKSVSPVPSSTRSTRSRKNVTYSESDSPEELPMPLPPVKPSRPAAKTKKSPPKKSPPKKSPPKKSPPKRSPPVKTKTLPNGSARVVAPSGRATRSSSKSISPKKDDIPLKPIAEQESHLIPSPPSQAEDQDQSQETKQTPEPVKADLPPSTSTLRISFTNAGIKRRAISQDPTEDLDGTTTNDNTPQVSPTLEANLQLGNDAVEVAASKKAPRKKRKWLKRGEVDPDDPVAVAKQQERFFLLDRADELLQEQIQAVRVGTHPHLSPLLAELAVRKERLLKACDLRLQLAKHELTTMRDAAKAAARNDHFDASCRILDDLCDEQRRKKFAILDERNAAERDPNAYPSLKTGRGSGGWPVHPDHLWSNGLQPSTSYELDGIVRERKLIDRGPGPIPLSVAKADLELFTEYKRKRIVPPTSPQKRRSHIAAPHKAPALGRHVPGQQLPSGAGRTQMPEPRQPSGAYEVKDLPPYKPGGSVPMRQTPTHSPSPTPARRASPLPGAQVHTPSNLASNGISSAGFATMKYPHTNPLIKQSQKSSQTLTTTAPAGGVRAPSSFGKYSTLPNGSASPFASVGQTRKL